MKSIYNPTESKVSITIKGDVYSVEAGESTVRTDEVAEKWIETHEFLQISDVKTDTPKVEKKEEVKEEEVKEEEVKEEPKKESIIKRAAKKVASKK